MCWEGRQWGAGELQSQQDPGLLCKLSDPGPQMGLVCSTAQSGPACLPRPDTYSREQQKRQAVQRKAERAREGPLCCPQPSLAHHELSSRLLNI